MGCLWNCFARRIWAGCVAGRTMAVESGVNIRSCDHMIDTEAPYCYLGMHFPRDCTGCSRYVEDAEPKDAHREKVWQEFAIGSAAIGSGYEIPESARYSRSIPKSRGATRSAADNNLGGQVRRDE